MVRGYSKRQFAQSDFDATGYGFPTEEGVFKAVLDCKRYGKTRNLIGYFTLENGQTIMTSAWQNDNYHGLQEVPFGAVMELEFVKNKRGVIHLRRATVLGYRTKVVLYRNEQGICVPNACRFRGPLPLKTKKKGEKL